MSRRFALQQELREGSLDAAIIVRVFDLSAGKSQEPPFEVFDLSPHFPGGVEIILNRPPDDDGSPNVHLVVVATPTDVTDLEGYVGDGSDGYAQYRTPDASFLVPHGIWRWQARIMGVPPGDYKSQIVRRTVYPNLVLP
jgi:hypothetical protein